MSKLKCCGKQLKPKRGKVGVFVCPKCSCIYRIVVVRKCRECSAKSVGSVTKKRGAKKK